MCNKEHIMNAGTMKRFIGTRYKNNTNNVTFKGTYYNLDVYIDNFNITSASENM